ncbi:hypothetical protein E2C01_051254 [Portunus trituberculatus]|uniref:Uncharacterized protein n=1 Tax=Portunus trituberculatus TaxID=210409 RepID=A0A5B7GJ31_PORTR|nr:hypothetical protein [Portunus trituberculatus]
MSVNKLGGHRTRTSPRLLPMFVRATTSCAELQCSLDRRRGKAVARRLARLLCLHLPLTNASKHQ